MNGAYNFKRSISNFWNSNQFQKSDYSILRRSKLQNDPQYACKMDIKRTNYLRLYDFDTTIQNTDA